MTTGRWAQIKEVFQSALDLPADERAEFVRRSCDGDTDLRTAVDDLLRSADTDFLSDGAVAYAPQAFEDSIRDRNIGRHIGVWVIERRIGAGGMGAVYLARRASEFNQEAALKLLTPGLESRGFVARFLQERQILAGLDHPNIARLLEGGATDDGQPYFAMEYIAGEPIDVYAQKHSLGVKDRLRLFQEICAAVQYAHQKLIVHRDIKPGNVLVTAQGVPKLLDFGIARLLNADGPGESTGLTQVGVRLMTPEYASPEQVRGEPVSTSTDVYSLGAVLYHLLTGAMPYELSNRTAAETERIVCEQDPRPPSQAAVMATRAKELRGDLDCIVLKALRKDPAQRYGSVEQLSADIGRYLEGSPIQARPQTLAYRAGRFITRHRVSVSFASVFAVVVITAASVFVWQARQVQKESLQNAQLSDFLQSVIGMSSDRDLSPLRRNFRTTPMIDVIRYGASRLDVDMAGQPAAQARLSALFSLALSENGDYADADRAARRGLDLIDRKKNPGLAALALYAQGTSDLFQGLLKEPYAELEEALHLMDQAAPERGSLDKALVLQHFVWAALIINGDTQTPELDRMLDRGLAEARARNGEASPTYALLLAMEGVRYLNEDHVPEAERAVGQAMRIQKSLSVLPAEYQWTLNARAYLRREQGRLAEALELKAQACASAESVYGRANTLFQMCRVELGNWQTRKGDVEGTVKILSEVLDESPRILPRALWLRAWVLYWRSQALLRLGRKNEATLDMQNCYTLTRQEWGENDAATRNIASALAQMSAADR